MSFCVAPLNGFNVSAAKADVGVILDFGTPVGKICKTCISMAIEDFYSNGNHSTMIVPHFRDSRSDVVAAASAAIDLLKNIEVMAIFGPQQSIQADFVINIGDKVEVPIISPATSPALSPKKSRYFIRSAWCTSYQVKAIAAIVKYFGWREVVFIYEDTNYGSGLVPFWTEDLLESSTLISYQSAVSPVSSDDQIRLELCKLMKMQTRVFIVHMLPDLASRFFKLAKEAGMMNKGYAWIIADVLTSLMASMDSASIEAMQGVLGVKAYIPESDEVRNFKKRWFKRFHKENPDMDRTQLNVFGLWAYDSITALAEAIEQVGVTSPQFNRLVDRENLTDLEAIGTSMDGQSLVSLIKNRTSKGLSGDFNITNGQLQPSVFEIVNVIGKGENTVGFWTKQVGISKELKPDDDQVKGSTKKENLDPIVWPGKTSDVPKGWDIPTGVKKLRVVVPEKGGFNEFIKVERNKETNAVEPTGFSIDVFEEVLKNMPYAVPIEYSSFKKDGGYDDLVEQIYLKNFDAVVGDVTVTADRSQYADFAIPYTESGVGIIVPIAHNDRKNAWIFMKPLTTGLWITIGAFFIFTGFVVWALEHRVNDKFRGSPKEQVGMIFWFSFSTLVFAHREKVESNLTRFVLIIWVFVVLVLTSSYTANLTSMLTVDQLQPKINNIDNLKKSGEYVGFQDGSFVEGFLMNNMGFDSSKLKNYTRLEEFDEALSKGSRNGGVSAIVDELPYIRLFLSKYCHKYTMIGQPHPTSGLGFAFPKGSPLVPDVSRAILKLKENKTMVRISKKWLGDAKGCTDTDGALSTSQKLNLDSFKGLFLIAGLSSSLALAIFMSTFLYEYWHILTSTASMKEKICTLARHFYVVKKDGSLSSKESRNPDHGERVFSAASPAISIPCDEDEMFSQDEGFATVEITPIQPPQESNS
ncbi:hypothetical protein C2S51_005016 [Perilla frutescens var. frutescens]|nr:hypothetical protein C2S51_005016 [Perilla frutescens var. frutescens]